MYDSPGGGGPESQMEGRQLLRDRQRRAVRGAPSAWRLPVILVVGQLLQFWVMLLLSTRGLGSNKQYCPFTSP